MQSEEIWNDIVMYHCRYGGENNSNWDDYPKEKDVYYPHYT